MVASLDSPAPMVTLATPELQEKMASLVLKVRKVIEETQDLMADQDPMVKPAIEEYKADLASKEDQVAMVSVETLGLQVLPETQETRATLETVDSKDPRVCSVVREISDPRELRVPLVTVCVDPMETQAPKAPKVRLVRQVLVVCRMWMNARASTHAARNVLTPMTATTALVMRDSNSQNSRLTVPQ